MTGKNVTGFWYVTVWQPGKYTIRLRRWPEESDQMIRAELEPGTPVPGVQAYRARKGVGIKAVRATIDIAGVQAQADVLKEAKEVTFHVTLPEGKSRLSARFIDEQGIEFGAYYAYISRDE
jgi:hypothetical protein